MARARPSEIKVNEKAKVGNITQKSLPFGDVDGAVAGPSRGPRRRTGTRASTHFPIEPTRGRPHHPTAPHGTELDADPPLRPSASCRGSWAFFFCRSANVRVTQPLLGGAFAARADPFALEFCVAKWR